MRINEGTGGINIENHVAQEKEETKEICDICNGTGVIQKQEQVEEIIWRNPMLSKEDVKTMYRDVEKYGEAKCMNCDENGMVED